MLMCMFETTRLVFRTKTEGQASKQPMLSSGVGQAFRSSSPVAEMVEERICMRTNRKWFTPWIRPYQVSRVSIKQAFAARVAEVGATPDSTRRKWGDDTPRAGHLSAE